MPLSLEIITPSGIVFSDENIDAVSLPTRNGEIQILAGHIPLITILDGGEIVVQKGTLSESVAVDCGYARCIGDCISVLTEAAINIDDSDESDIEQAKLDAEKAIEEAKKSGEISPEEIERLESRARVAITGLLAKARKRNAH